MNKFDYVFLVMMLCSTGVTVFAGNVNNHACVGLANDNCNSNPDTTCQQTGDCTDPCSWCPNDIALPDNFCIPEEGRLCLTTGAPFKVCGDETQPRKRGTCGGTPCMCNNVMDDGTCNQLFFSGCTGDVPN